MTARRPTGTVRRPLVAPALAVLTVLLVACATPSDPTGQPPLTDPSRSPSGSASAPVSEPPAGASYFLRVEPPEAGDSLTITLLNEFVEPAASATIPSGDPMEASGRLAPGTYTLEARGATCEGELQLSDGVEVDAIVRIDAAGTACAVEPVGSHAPGQSHQFGPR